MIEMSLEEVEQAAAKIENLAKALMDAPNAKDAKHLRDTCKHYNNQMRGLFGNVAEQLGRISTAARLYEKSRIDLNRAKLELHQAVTRMHQAIDIHR